MRTMVVQITLHPRSMISMTKQRIAARSEGPDDSVQKSSLTRIFAARVHKKGRRRLFMRNLRYMQHFPSSQLDELIFNFRVVV